MKKLLLAVSCALLLGNLGTRSASAATFNFSFSGFDTGSGTITATQIGSSGVYNITGITGSITGPFLGTRTITGLIPAGVWPFPATLATNDDLLYFPATIPAVDPGQALPSFLDTAGVSFYLGAPGPCNNLPTDSCFNLYYGSDAGIPTPATTGYNLFYPNTVGNDLLSTFTLTPATTAATPEPGSLILLGTGATGLIGVMRRRFARNA